MWKIKRNDLEFSTEHAEQLRSWAKYGRIVPDDQVHDGTDWKPAREIPELSGQFPQGAHAPVNQAVATHVCTNCGYQGQPERIVPGSTALGCVLILLLVIPGLIYAVWQQTQTKPGCPNCKTGGTMIPINSPMAQKIIGS
ncbi:MAG TPA: hypothetical protein VMO47_10540 [Rhodothermales bacterium]|nr:hypothetical protein [Rhodothermales bacterium]